MKPRLQRIPYFWHSIFPVLVGKMEARTAWQLYTGSTVGTLVFILIAAGLAVLLWRRRRNPNKNLRVETEIEMNVKTTNPSKSKEKGEYSLVSKEPA